jgi:hypothetical protein
MAARDILDELGVDIPTFLHARQRPEVDFSDEAVERRKAEYARRKAEERQARNADRDARQGAESAAGGTNDGDKPLMRIVTGDAFLRELRIPAPLIDGIVPRGQLYSLTGPTGHGKTAVAAAMQMCVALGRPFAGRDVEHGRVLVLAGENPDDYGLRLLATAQAMKVPPATLTNVGIIAGSFSLAAATPGIGAAALEFGELTAVFVDTSAAFFDGEDENANAAMRVHASRLRALCDLPGKPAVVVLCHPTKNASKENLIPRGGGAFLAEVDGNLTCWREDKLVTLHWAGKVRGPGFEPLTFELAPQTLAIVDAKGRPVASVAAVAVADDRAEALSAAALSDENRMLAAMVRIPGGSLAELAVAAGFTSATGTPQKSRVHRLLQRLKEDGLAKPSRAGRWALTPKGRQAAAEVAP